MNNLFLNLFNENEEYKKILQSSKNNIINITGLTDTAKPHFLYGILKNTNKKILVIAKNETYAKSLNNMLSFFNINSHIFWERELNFYNIDAKSSDIFVSRINALNSILKDREGIFITTLCAVSQPVIPKDVLENMTFKINNKEEVSLDDLTKKLSVMGYSREPMVEFKGQYSVRGGVLDIFSPLSDFPYRIEFFGDEVDSIRLFDEKTQKSIENLDSVEITVSKEVVFGDDKCKELKEKLREIVKSKKGKLKEEIKSDIIKLENERYFPSIDKYIGLIYESNNTLLNYFDKEDTIIVIDEPQRLFENKEALRLRRDEELTDLIEKNIIIPDIEIYKNEDEIIDKLLSYTTFGIMNILTSNKLYKPHLVFNVTVTETPSYYGKLNLFSEDIINYKNKGYKVVIPVSENKTGNILNFLTSLQIFPAIIDENDEISKAGVYLLKKKGVMGFNYPDLKFVLLYDGSIFGEYKKVKKKKVKNDDILSFADLKLGDYVVHTVHGIGQYLGTLKMEVDGISRDFLKIKYYGTDILYVPVNQLENLSKYIGAGERNVRLNRFGGQEFNRIKERVRNACSDLADKLIKLYAERENTKGHQYMEDTDLQALFEQTFPFDETEDQLRSIEEVKKDMESPRPMDRLLCGDVGYGKTEVAMRAAFKCAAEGKQTAYLASTTVLCQQHYNSFRGRMEEFPVKVEMLSRFKSKKQQTEIIKKLKTGEIDIIIGTHRLLSKDVEFKDLGLLIVDEEQRFGVEHKERLKEIKKNIEVLTLSATPIPRTLHMSMLGIRDMSVLKEPPLDRFPVQTYVLEYNEEIVANAISKEVARGGQVFYLYNNVEGINSVARRIGELFPDINVKVAHGKMSETQIEKTFIEMLNGEIDVLVSTTIIETGIDIANANTIIVENADRLGLSQLYQLRGRVGRSNRLAYCYLTYQKNKALTEQSESRLKAIKEFTEFGSGFKIALRDLELRGAGNVLGAEQHGHMDAVGYDMYIKILQEAIKKKKGETVSDMISCRVDIKENAFIPSTYIENHDIRMDIYKKISSIKTKEDMSEVFDELIDRFSDMPESVVNLGEISLIKAMAESVGICEISDFNLKITFKFANSEFFNFEKISEISEKYPQRIMVSSGAVPSFSYKMYKNEKDEKLSNIKNILQILK